MSSKKRKRKEQARLNEQNQFTIKWPTMDTPLTIINAIKEVGKKHPASSKSTIFTFGINAVARNLRRSTTTNKDQNNQDPPMQTLVLIAKHTSSLLIRHLPFLAVVQPQNQNIVRCCGIPLSSERLGQIFGLKSAAVLSLTVKRELPKETDLKKADSTKEDQTNTISDVVQMLLDSIQDKHLVQHSAFVNINVATSKRCRT